MKRLRILLIFTVMFLCFLLNACQGAKQFIYNNYNYFGAVLKSVVYTDKNSFSNFKENADSLLENLNNSFNEEIALSDIGRFNKAIDGEIVEIQKETYDLIGLIKDIYKITSGAYNPCVYYLVDLWGFSSRFSSNTDIVKEYDRAFDERGFFPIPEKKYIDAFSYLADFNKVRCYQQDEKFYLVKENSKVSVDGIDYYLKLDLGGLIKGYAIDKLNEVAKNLQIDKGYLSYGTSSVSLLENKKGDTWDLLLTNPRPSDESNQSYLKIPLKNKQVSSSGDYERFYEIDGKRYSHIINAKLGAPIDNGMCAVTVLCKSATAADMLSTALCVMGKDKALEFIKSDYVKDNNIEVIFAYDTKERIEIYTNLADNFTLLDERFIIITI